MKKFNFSLQFYLNLKKDEQEQAKLNLAMANAKSSELMQKVEECKESLANLSVEQNLSDLKTLELYRVRLTREMIANQKAWLHNENVKAQRQKEYNEKANEVKVYEKLKEKKYNIYKKELAKAEQNLYDEINARKNLLGGEQYGI